MEIPNFLQQKSAPGLHPPPRAEVTPATTTSDAPGTPKGTEPQVVPVINPVQQCT